MKLRKDELGWQLYFNNGFSFGFAWMYDGTWRSSKTQAIMASYHKPKMLMWSWIIIYLKPNKNMWLPRIILRKQNVVC